MGGANFHPTRQRGGRCGPAFWGDQPIHIPQDKGAAGQSLPGAHGDLTGGGIQGNDKQGLWGGKFQAAALANCKVDDAVMFP